MWKQLTPAPSDHMILIQSESSNNPTAPPNAWVTKNNYQWEQTGMTHHHVDNAISQAPNIWKLAKTY